MSKIIGKILYKLGFKLNCSTGICGNTTYGYGKLDINGYWKYPVYIIN